MPEPAPVTRTTLPSRSALAALASVGAHRQASNRARGSDDGDVPDHVGVRPSDEGLAVRHRLLELLGVEDRLEVVCRVEGHHGEGVRTLVAVDREDVVLAQAGKAPGDRDVRVAIVGDELLG